MGDDFYVKIITRRCVECDKVKPVDDFKNNGIFLSTVCCKCRDTKYLVKKRRYDIRKNRMIVNGGKITKGEWKSVLDKYGNVCLYPGCKETKLEMDHVIPVSLGGKNSIENVQPLCTKHNRKKHAKIIDYRVLGKWPP